MDQFYQGIQEHHDGQVVSNLLVVGLHLETEGEAEKRRAQKPFPPAIGLVRIHQRRQHPGEQGDGLHFGVVPHLNNLEIVAAEGHGDGAAHRHRQAYPQGQEQKECAQHRDKQPGGRAFAGEQQIV